MTEWLFAINQDKTSEGWEDAAIKNFKGNPLKNLARETIQNSLDAPRPRGIQTVLDSFTRKIF